MRGMLNKKTLFVTLLILGVIFALFAFLIPSFGGIEKDEEILLLDKNDKTVLIDYRIEVINSSGENSTSNTLGERFRVKYIIHYREDAVRPSFDEVFADTSFAPFELMNEVKISQRTVDEWKIGGKNINIVEYTYEVELAIFNALVEDVYYLSAIELDYLIIMNSNVGVLNLSYTHPLHIADFYGEEIDGVNFISAKNIFQDNQATKARLFMYAGYIFAVFTIIYLFSGWRDKIVLERVRQQLSAEQELAEIFNGFADEGWLTKESAYIRMRELERLAIVMAWTFKNLRVVDFYQKLAGENLEQLFISAWDSNKSQVSYKDVGRAFSILSKEYRDVMREGKNGIRKFWNFRNKKDSDETSERR